MNVGEVYESKRCGKLEILEYINYKDVVVRFQDTGEVYTFYKQAIVYGNVLDRMCPTVVGVGYLGRGDFKATHDGGNTKCYRAWIGMLTRCYDPESWHEAYIGCSVDENWHNFQNFAEWYYTNYIEGWEVDKDFCIFGNKHYSEEFCTFLPQEINTFAPRSNKRNFQGYTVTSSGKFMTQLLSNRFGNYYKIFNTSEEAYSDYCRVKNIDAGLLAEKWKGKIDDRVYSNLVNFDTDAYINSF